MYVKYDSFGRVDKPNIVLCNPGVVLHATKASEQVLGILSGCEALELVLHFNAPAELNFRINKSFIRADSPICMGTGASQVCVLPESEVNAQIQLYHNVANRRVLHIGGIGYFMITSVTEAYSDGMWYKDVKAESIEVELREKKIPYIQDGTYKFFYRRTETIPQDAPRGIFNMILDKFPLWTVSIDDTVRERYRTFESVDLNTNCLSFLTEKLQEAFDCIILFDIDQRWIYVYDKEEYAVSSDRLTSVYLTSADLINSLEVTQSADSFYTALECLGNDNISIASVNPLGGNVIYNFSYFFRWFSADLRAAVSAWANNVADAQPTYATLCSQRDDLVILLSNQTSEVNMYATILSVYQRLYDNLQNASGDDEVNRVIDEINEVIEFNGDGELVDPSEDISDILDKVQALIDEYQQLMDEAQDAVDETQGSLDDVNADIGAIVASLSLTNTNNFSAEQYEELSHYIFEGSYTDEYVAITDSMTTQERQEQRQLIYDRASAYLNERCTPRQEFNIGVSNFIFSEEYEFMATQLQPGALINVSVPASMYTRPSLDPIMNYTEDLGHYEQLFVLSVTLNYEDSTLSISVGNRFDKSNPKSLFNEIFK